MTFGSTVAVVVTVGRGIRYVVIAIVLLMLPSNLRRSATAFETPGRRLQLRKPPFSTFLCNRDDIRSIRRSPPPLTQYRGTRALSPRSAEQQRQRQPQQQQLLLLRQQQQQQQRRGEMAMVPESFGAADWRSISTSRCADPTTVSAAITTALAQCSDSNVIINSNQALVENRLAVIRAKQHARAQSVQERYERNLQIKRLLHSNGHPDVTATTTAAITSNNQSLALSLYAVKVSVCEQLRRELKLSGREKRGRVFVQQHGLATTSLSALQTEIQSHFRALRKGSYILSAGYPELSPNNDTSIVSNSNSNSSSTNSMSFHNPTEEPDSLLPHTFWPVLTDAHVVRTFQAADTFFAQLSPEQKQSLKRPCIRVHIRQDPNAPGKQPPPTYLYNMPDPATSTHMTMLSFYAFPPNGIVDPEAFAVHLRKAWKPFHVLGRIYVATEGVNAQMSVPTNVVDRFMECCRSVPELTMWMENGINIDPVPLSQQEFAIAGVPANGIPTSPFRNLHIRVRQQVVADGFDKVYDWQSAGYDMPPLEWHAKLNQIKALRESQSEACASITPSTSNVASSAGDVNSIMLPIVLDCRNKYETDLGRFDGAEPLDTETFRESWDILQRRLDNVPKDTPIMTYCTGGIRCVKVGAYLTQELGFTNVSRLAGGIIAYDRTLQGQQQEKVEESMFRGTNFVFDGRLGRPITDDAMGICVSCGTETSLVSNCRNGNCHKRMIQCISCRTSLMGTCSDACQQRLISSTSNGHSSNNNMMRPQRRLCSVDGILSDDENNSNVAAATTTGMVPFQTLEEYSSGYSSPPPSIYRELELNTRVLIPSGSHMISGLSQGRLLMQLASMTRDGRILEIGTFTGFATVCLWEGAAHAGHCCRSTQAKSQHNNTTLVGSRSQGPYVMTMERDRKAFDVAVAQLQIVASLGTGEAAAEALCALRSNKKANLTRKELSNAIQDVVFLVPSNDHHLAEAACELVHVSDALATLEEMAAGLGPFQAVAPFDLVFVDADKTRLLDYVEACLNNDRVLKPGGFIVVDNVLWKGLVLDVSGGRAGTGSSSNDESGADGDSTDSTEADDNGSHDTSTCAEVRQNRRARKLANKMHTFNREIAKDPRVEVLVLPIRDGLSVIRKKIIIM